MNHTPDTTASPGHGGGFDARQAAALLDQTTGQARRKFEPSPPWLLAARGAAVLAALGAIWLSVRGQHPYRGPTAADIPILIAFIAVNFAATVAVRGRATAGIRGTTRFRPAEITILVLAWVSVPVLIWALAAAGSSLGQVPDHGADHPRPGLGRRQRGTGRLAQLRHRGRGRRHRYRGRVRRAGRVMGGRRRGPVRRAPGQRRRHRPAAARLTVCHD